MKKIQFKKIEKNIAEFALMIEELMELWAFESDDDSYIQARSYLHALKKNTFHRSQHLVSLEEVLSVVKPSNSTELHNLITLLIHKYEFYFSTHSIEWYIDNEKMGAESIYTDIYEDISLPHYFILHVDLFQNYKLLSKLTGRSIQFVFHDICPSVDPCIIHGRHLKGPFADYDFCSTSLDLFADDPEKTATVTNAVDTSMFDKLIFPTGTNVEHLYVPCRNAVDFLFNRDIQDMYKSHYNGKLSLRTHNTTGVQNSGSDDDYTNLPF